MRPLELIERFLAEMSAEAIPYCHFKSTTNIEASLTGGTDLDLLVSSDRREECIALLERHDFRLATDPYELKLPGVCHYFGYDHPSGSLIHVHLHFQLIVGDDLLKNYRLPVDEAFLRSAWQHKGIYLPSAEVEFIVFVLRMVLKRRLLSVLARFVFLLGNPISILKQLVGMEFPSMGPSSQAEFDDLKTRISETELEHVLAKSFPFIDPELFQQYRGSLGAKGGRFAWLVAGRRLARSLTPYRRYSGFTSVTKILWQAFKLRVRAVLNRVVRLTPVGKMPSNGGRIIAFVGGDGAGKTTMVDNTYAWLGRYYSVARIHLGKPPKGVSWYLILGLMKGRALLLKRSGDLFHQAVRYWLIARYRYRAYRRALRLRRRGTVVILDRLPLPGSKYMDTPRISALKGKAGTIVRSLAAMEERWHEQIVADELIVMRLDPKIAAIRRPEDDQEMLAKRSGEIWNRNWPAAYAHLVDASQPLEKVVSEVRSLVWDFMGAERKVFEMVGPAGAGKSTLANELRGQLCNVRTSLSWREGKGLCLLVALRRLPEIVRGLLNKVPVRHLKTAISIETVLMLLHPLRRRHHILGSSIILEIGPAFHIAFLEKESPSFSRQWLNDLRLCLRESIDVVFWLDASNDLLLSRINERPKLHRIKNVTSKNGARFLDDYRASFADIIGDGGGGLSVIKIDTGHLSVAESAAVVISQMLQDGS